MNSVKSTLFLTWVFVLMSQLAAAQSPNDPEALPIPPALQAVADAFRKPLHPVVRGVASGGGVGLGIGYDTPKGHDWFQSASALVTVNRYWAIKGEIGHQTPRSRIGVFGEARRMGHLDFFGIGPGSHVLARSNFQLQEKVAGLRGWFRPRADVRLGGSLQTYSPELGRGTSPTVPSIEEVFDPGEIPGLSYTPTFVRYRGFAEIVYPRPADPDQPGAQERRSTYQVALEAVRDQDGGRFSFHRVETEVQQRFAGLRPGQRLTLHGLISVTNPDAVVPFYLQYTLGGGGLNAFRPDTIGSDGTRTTLRGYRSYRFRDRDLLLMQAEYRIPVRGPFHTTVFYDAGQVAGHAADLFKGLKQGTGFSLNYMRKDRALVRLDVGYGSGEGVRLFWGFTQ